MLKNNTGDYVWFDSELFIKWRNWRQPTDTNHNFVSDPPFIWSHPPFWYPPFRSFQDGHFNLSKNMPIKHANLQGKNIKIFLKHADLLEMKFLQKKTF